MRAATFGNLCSGTPPILELSPEPRVRRAHLSAIPLPITESIAYHSPVKPRSIGTASTRPWVALGATTKTRSASSRSAPLAKAEEPAPGAAEALQRPHPQGREHAVFPSNWTELDIWQNIDDAGHRGGAPSTSRRNVRLSCATAP
jgi:hypothetical protein